MSPAAWSLLEDNTSSVGRGGGGRQPLILVHIHIYSPISVHLGCHLHGARIAAIHAVNQSNYTRFSKPIISVSLVTFSV